MAIFKQKFAQKRVSSINSYNSADENNYSGCTSAYYFKDQIS